ncbi:MAG TPA: hypothetical protein VF141_06500 [Chryseolinea sp.]
MLKAQVSLSLEDLRQFNFFEASIRVRRPGIDVITDNVVEKSLTSIS